jgi:hypothetical protein
LTGALNMVARRELAAFAAIRAGMRRAELRAAPLLDKTAPRTDDRRMPSARFAEALKLANELPEDERAELARELVRTLPEDLELEDDGFSDEWKHEIRRRLREEPRGEALTLDQLRARADKMISRGE